MSQISHIKYKDIIEAGRFDADFFRPDFIEIENTLKNNKCDEFINLCHFVKKGIFDMPPTKYRNKGIPFLRVSNTKSFFINTSDLVYLDEETNNENKGTELSLGDIVLSKVGTIGDAVINLDYEKVNISQNNIGIKIKHNLIDSGFIVAFLNSKYGKGQIKKKQSGQVQEKLVLDDIKYLRIPRINNEKQIGDLVRLAYKNQEQSKQLYQEAEDLLLGEIGLKEHTISHTLTFSTTKKAVDETGRYDADYFQPKYDELIEKIENYKGGWEQLINLTTYINNGNQPPYSENGNIKFFSQKWIKDKGIDYSFLESTEEPMVESSFFDEEKNKPSLVSKGDILYYSVGANLGYCHTYLADEKIAVGSFINIIRADTSKFDSIAMGVILNSMIGRMQADRDKSGVAQPYIYAKNLRKFKIPLINPQLQKEISDKIKESFKLRNESKELLEQAKKMVEDEIEKE